MFWLILCYFLHATGELCLSPIGLSMITKLSPKGVTGILMGTWFLAYSFAQYVAALIAQLTGVKEGGAVAATLPEPTETVMVYGSVFGSIGWVALGVGMLWPWSRQCSHGACTACIEPYGRRGFLRACGAAIFAESQTCMKALLLGKSLSQTARPMSDSSPDLPDLPEVEANDPEPVAVAIETARALFKTGERLEALRWLRRAAERAEESGDDVRALNLARCAADSEHRAAKYPATAGIAGICSAAACSAACSAAACLSAAAARAAATESLGTAARAAATRCCRCQRRHPRRRCPRRRAA